MRSDVKNVTYVMQAHHAYIPLHVTLAITVDTTWPPFRRQPFKLIFSMKSFVSLFRFHGMDGSLQGNSNLVTNEINSLLMIAMGFIKQKLYFRVIFIPGPLFTKRLDVLPSNLVKSRSREIRCYNERSALKFDRHLGSAAADVPVKFQND